MCLYSFIHFWIFGEKKLANANYRCWQFDHLLWVHLLDWQIKQNCSRMFDNALFVLNMHVSICFSFSHTSNFDGNTRTKQSKKEWNRKNDIDYHLPINPCLWYNQRAKCHSFNIVTSCCSFISLCLRLVLLFGGDYLDNGRIWWSRFIRAILFSVSAAASAHSFPTLSFYTCFIHKNPIHCTEQKSAVLWNKLNAQRPTHEWNACLECMTNRIVIYDFFHFATYFCLLLWTVWFCVYFVHSEIPN